jgi:murein DD-endopeptidase MepM/ murein hydrolase activator NlpD
LVRAAAVTAVALIVAAPASARHDDAVPQLSFAWPASGVVTRGFGWDHGDWHPGIDIGTLQSLDIRAAAPGVVESVGYATGFEGYGQIVLVDVGYGFETLYAHLSQAAVQPGDVVDTGQKLGLAGCTGYCTGTHLHFELRLHGEAMDPALLMAATIPGPEGG